MEKTVLDMTQRKSQGDGGNYVVRSLIICTVIRMIKCGEVTWMGLVNEHRISEMYIEF